MVPIDFNGFWSSFTPKTRDVSDVTQTRGGFVYCISKFKQVNKSYRHFYLSLSFSDHISDTYPVSLCSQLHDKNNIQIREK